MMMSDSAPSFESLYAPVTGALLCSPTFHPDDGDEDHHQLSTNPLKEFYGITAGKYIGVVLTSVKSLETVLMLDPTGRHIVAPTWLRLIELWNIECKEYHNHQHWPLPSSASSESASPPPSPSPSPSASRSGSPSATRTPLSAAEHAAIIDRHHKARAAQMKAARREREADVAEHAARVAAWFARRASVKAFFARRFEELEAEVEQRRVEDQREPNEDRSKIVAAPARPPPINISDISEDDNPAKSAPKCGRKAKAHEVGEGSSSHPVIARALDALKHKPGADLLFTREEGVVGQFIDGEVSRKES
ncbi:hypothetical protein B0H15DRAFT_943712 [Mycena belliarum]|uniref:Uncharacterized protein n=1 Tax=Mycena belliarum TaxID=1033014 RepID=A0AAD6UFI1_9AGAR|nr:hypothetical protein B0H15DRAFT_943712 [Mycena belliae]